MRESERVALSPSSVGRASSRRRDLVRRGRTRAAAWSALALIASAALGSAAWSQPTNARLPSGIDLSEPLTLEQCVRVAVAVNPALTLAEDAVREARATTTETRAGWLPSLQFGANASAQKTRGAGSVGGASPRTTSWGTDLVLSQTLYQSGLQEQIGSARASEKASRLGVHDTRRTLVLGVAQSYYTALAATALVEVAARTLETSLRHVDRAQERVTQGVAAQSDLYPFQVEVAQARLQVITAETLMKTSLTGLKQAIGLPSEVSIQLADQLGRPELSGELPDLLAAAYRDRSDILQQRAVIESARLNVRVAQIERGPVLNVAGNVTYGITNDIGGTEGLVQAGVTLPLYDGQLTKARADSARAAYDATLQALQQLQLAISAEVESAYLTAVEANQAIDAAETALKAAQVSMDAAEGKYAEGVGTPVDVSDAQLKWRQAESDRVQAYYTYNTALAALRAAVGRMAAPGAE